MPLNPPLPRTIEKTEESPNPKFKKFLLYRKRNQDTMATFMDKLKKVSKTVVDSGAKTMLKVSHAVCGKPLLL
jgi:hypothetical protein